MAPEESGPEKWPEPLEILFDNGEHSVIAGTYDGKRILAFRWIGDTDSPLSLPTMKGYVWARESLWHIVPPFLGIPLLHGLLDELARNSGKQVGRIRSDWILTELTNFHKPGATV